MRERRLRSFRETNSMKLRLIVSIIRKSKSIPMRRVRPKLAY